MKWIPFLYRYGKSFMVGTLVGASRALVFAVILENHSPLIANVVSLLFRIVVAFVLQATITWRDRPGRFGTKFIRFSINKGVTSLVKVALFPLWLVIFPCPLHNLAYKIMGVFEGTIVFDFFSRIVSCELLSLVTMDAVVSLTLGFSLHNWISFAPKRR